MLASIFSALALGLGMLGIYGVMSHTVEQRRREIGIRVALGARRAQVANMIIEDGYTSSQHAQIAMDQHGMCKLYDRGSTNGTYVNGVRITETPLQHGLVIRIGSTDIRFLAE